MARPVSCECGDCVTCYNREKKRRYTAKYPERVRAIARRNTAAHRARLLMNPAELHAWRAARNERARARYAQQKRAKELELADPQDMGPIEYLPFDKWLEKYGPIGSHGKAAWWSCL